MELRLNVLTALAGRTQCGEFLGQGWFEASVPSLSQGCLSNPICKLMATQSSELGMTGKLRSIVQLFIDCLWRKHSDYLGKWTDCLWRKHSDYLGKWTDFVIKAGKKY